jgi:hypothetical protein
VTTVANTLAYYNTAANTPRKVKGSNLAADTGNKKNLSLLVSFSFSGSERLFVVNLEGGGGAVGGGRGWLSLKVITTWMRFPRAASLA